MPHFVEAEYSECYPCGHTQPGLIDAVVPITYSEHLGQMHTALRNYKEPLVSASSRRYAAIRLAAILWRFLDVHERCVATAAGTDHFDVVTAVPSSSLDRDAESPLRRLIDWCAPIAGRHQRVLEPAGTVTGRTYDPDRYKIREALRGSRILLIDDTWTAGGHARSAAWHLRQAGATSVGLVVIGRHVQTDWKLGSETNADRLAALPRPFDWDVCAVHA